MVRRWLDKLGAGPWGSIRLAAVLAVLSLPVVMWAIANPTIRAPYIGSLVPLEVALTIALPAVLAAALAAGFVGGRLAHHPTLSVFAATAVAWFIGMASLSLVPAALGMNYIGAVFCIDGCQPFVTAASPLSGGIAWALGLAMSTMEIAPPLIAIALLAVSRRFARRGELVTAAVLVVAAEGVAQVMTFVGGGLPAIAAFLCLGGGVVAWSSVIVSAPDRAGAPVEPLQVPSAA